MSPSRWSTAYKVTDFESDAFLRVFKSTVPCSKGLFVGCQEEATANIVAESGFEVIGVDLREYNKSLGPCNYHFFRHDFCALPNEFWRDYRESFDFAVALSTIGEFGLNLYSEGIINLNYDILAVRYMYDALRPHGKIYLTIPFGKTHRTDNNGRVYNFESFRDRLEQDFEVTHFYTFCSKEVVINEKSVAAGEVIPIEEAMNYDGEPLHHVSALAIMTKKPFCCIAPDGR